MSEKLNCPYGLAFDVSSSLYVTDYHNNRIQKFPISDQHGTTVAGLANGTAGNSLNALHLPVGLVIDPNKNIYFTDRANDRLMYWKNAANEGTMIAGGKG